MGNIEQIQGDVAEWLARNCPDRNPPADTARMVAEFHETFCGEPFGGCDIHNSGLRRRLQMEEALELDTALADGDLVATAHELADVVYVAYGTAHSLGIPLDAVITAVHRANMAKAGPDGRAQLREDGKVLKPPGWQPADIGAVLSEYGRSDDYPA